MEECSDPSIPVERDNSKVSMDEIRNFSILWRGFKERCRGNLAYPLVFKPTEDWKGEFDWERLLFNRILPHSDCLVIAVAGGTNTGKSTITNILVGEQISPVVHTAGATKRPVLITSPNRFDQLLEGSMFPQFSPAVLVNPEDVLDNSHPQERLFVTKSNAINNSWLLLDTPDIDSILRENWDIADRVISASDVVIAVLTEEKYNDYAVVEFFRRVKQEGKMIIPLMNKVNMGDPRAIEYAREQVKHFLNEIGLENEIEAFAFPRTSEIYAFSPVSMSDENRVLREFLEMIPIEDTKLRVLGNSIRAVQNGFALWFKNVLVERYIYFKSCLSELEEKVKSLLREFSPVPPKEIETHLKSAIIGKVGKWKYFLLLPTGVRDIFSGVGKNKEQLYRISEEIEIRNKKVIMDLFESLLKQFSNSAERLPEEIKRDFVKGLEIFINEKDRYINEFEDKIKRELNLIPDSIMEQLDALAEDFVSNNPLTGLKFVRFLSVLSFVLGSGILFFGLIPGASLIPEIITFGGASIFTFVLENKGFGYLRGKVWEFVNKWLDMKRARVFEIVKGDLLNKLCGNLYEFVQIANEFMSNECVKRLVGEGLVFSREERCLSSSTGENL